MNENMISNLLATKLEKCNKYYVCGCCDICPYWVDGCLFLRLINRMKLEDYSEGKNE